MAAPLGWHLYAGAVALAGPAIRRRDVARLSRDGVPPARIAERDGRATLPRPDGPLIWIHAVSVGEAVSVLDLAARLARDAAVLLTTTSATSARIVADRLPPGCLHQFAPLDTAPAVRRFLDHWHPALAVLAESEIWPRQIVEAADGGIPVALVNARLSDRSLRNWRRAPGLARHLLSRLSLIAAQDRRTADGLLALGADPARTRVTGTLKTAAAPLDADPRALADLRHAIGDRPVWVAASTHPGEEEAAIAAHRALLARHPGLLLILVPRHPQRGGDVAAALSGWNVARRSQGALPGPRTQIYLADTLGEMGLWFRLTRAAFIGGSLADHGGHNPLEAVRLGAYAVSGPHVANFSDIYADLAVIGAATVVPGGAALPKALSRMLSQENPPALPPATDLTATLADDLRALVCPGYDPRVRVVAPNFKRRLSGVTATVVRLVPVQAARIPIRAAGPALPAHVPQIPLSSLPFLPMQPAVWHARRNVEMLGGLALRHGLRKPLKLLFTSASQRRHTGLTKWLIRRQDAVVATSHRSAAYLEVPCDVIMHGIDTDAFRPAPDRAALRARLGLPPDGTVVGCFGRIRAQKGTDAFVDALLTLLPDRPYVTGIVMGRAVDKDRAFLDDLRSRIGTAGLSDRLRILPEVPVDAMAEWYAALDLYVAPQRWEGFGLTPLEAAACGVPSVATRVGAFEDLVCDGTTGLLVPPDDTPAMARAMAGLLDDPARLAAMGGAARARAESMSLSAEGDALIAIYRRLLGLGG